jgi:sugar/nucleoside kinase (ribokinase family)
MARAGLAGHLIAGIERGMVDTPGLADALRAVRLVVTNAAGWAAFAGRLPGGLTAVETQGTQGGVIHQPRGQVELVATVTAQTVDATGAGDCFAGAPCH